MNGWIKLHRKLLGNALWRDCNTNQKVVMITLLLMASHEDNTWIFKGEEYTVKAGQFVTSLQSIADQAGVSVNVIRKSLTKFKKYKFCTYKSTNKNRLITIENWAKYQDWNKEENKEQNKQGTSKEQARNNYQEVKEVQEGKDVNKDIVSDIPFADIINHLNRICGTGFKHAAESNKKHIRARWNEGYRLADFHAVIEKKAREWQHSDMAKYLRPSTLFGTKFDEYLNQVEATPKGGLREKMSGTLSAIEEYERMKHERQL